MTEELKEHLKRKNMGSELPQDLVELIRVASRLPDEHRATLSPSIDSLTDSVMRRRRILGLVQDALSQLRLDMKYLMFDLEATRRERDEYREKAGQ